MNRSEPLAVPSEVEPSADRVAAREARSAGAIRAFRIRPASTAKRRRDAGKGSNPFRDLDLNPAHEQQYERLVTRRGFLDLLQSEQRRTDRSKVPCSIALFRLDRRRSGWGSVHALVSLLCSATRETDFLGYLREDLVGALLTATNEEGVDGFVRKIAACVPDKQISWITGTYPGQQLDSLIAEGEEMSSASPHLEEGPVRNGYRAKRALDVVGATIAILLSSPVMLLTAIAVGLTSPGPIILKQVRLGKRGVPFVFYKFRSMVVGGDDRIHREYVTSLISGDLEGLNQGSAERPLYKIKSDPRVTPVGRFIRKTSIDELPQLFNVLKGEMSLVGPRPPLAYEAEKYQSWHLRRILEAKPGMTGIWQVEGRSKTSFDDMVRMDLRYIESSSLIVDLKILIKTVKVVFGCEGAN